MFTFTSSPFTIYCAVQVMQDFQFLIVNFLVGDNVIDVIWCDNKKNLRSFIWIFWYLYWLGGKYTGGKLLKLWCSLQIWGIITLALNAVDRIPTVGCPIGKFHHIETVSAFMKHNSQNHSQHQLQPTSFSQCFAKKKTA